MIHIACIHTYIYNYMARDIEVTFDVRRLVSTRDTPIRGQLPPLHTGPLPKARKAGRCAFQPLSSSSEKSQHHAGCKCVSCQTHGFCWYKRIRDLRLVFEWHNWHFKPSQQPGMELINTKQKATRGDCNGAGTFPDSSSSTCVGRTDFQLHAFIDDFAMF